jgi:2-polyprenyl-3-methyl-5-hydroxy-6-metoxy-1,4-benzoquinol methylase
MPPAVLTERRRRPELMDQPELDVAEHRDALAGLRRLNLASGTCRQLWKHVAAFASRRRKRRLRVLDIASGGGDVPLGLWKLASRHGVDLQVLGLDVSPTACQYASSRCAQAGGSIAFAQANVTRDALPTGFDVVTCSLFLHHLAIDEAAALLAKMAAAGDLLLVSDLRRCAAGYALAQIACRTLTSSPVVRFDGPQSVANAFSLREMRQLCHAAGLPDARVRRAWPCRMLVIREGS